MAEVSELPMSALIGDRTDRSLWYSWTVVILSLSVGSWIYSFRPRWDGLETEDYIIGIVIHHLAPGASKTEWDWQQIEWFTYKYVKIDTVLMCAV